MGACVCACAVYVYMIVFWGCDEVTNYSKEIEYAEVRRSKEERRGN